MNLDWGLFFPRVTPRGNDVATRKRVAHAETCGPWPESWAMARKLGRPKNIWPAGGPEYLAGRPARKIGRPARIFGRPAGQKNWPAGGPEFSTKFPRNFCQISNTHF